MQKRNIIYLTLAVILALVFILTGCSSPSPTTTAAPPATSATTTPTTTLPPPSTSAASPTPTSPVVTTASPTASPTATVQTGGIFTMITANAPSSFGYPVKAVGFAPNFAIVPCLESLLQANTDGSILPKLATSWDIAPDKSSITFHLRQGVKFQDGTDFNAQAAKWNLDLFLARGTGSAADWKSIDVVDNYTVRVNLKQFKNTQLTNFDGVTMISPTAVQKNGVDWAITHPVGTGPFTFKSFIPNTSLEYTRFDGYWGGKPNVDGIKFIYITDATTAAMAFEGGDALAWEQADPQTAYTLMQSGKYKEETRPGPGMYLIPDGANADSPFAKLEVREAAVYAIDRPTIVKNMGYNSWQAINQPADPSQFGYVANLQNSHAYDPDKAKQLLAAAGYPNGFTTSIITSSAFPKDPLVAIQGYLAAVGIKANIDVQSPSAWAQTRLTGWKNGLFFVTHGATDSNYCAFLERYYTPKSAFAVPVMYYPAGWLDQLNQMLASSDPTQYQAMAQQMVQTYTNNVMEIPLWIQEAVYLEDLNVHAMGIGTHTNGFGWNAANVWISK